MFERTDFPNSPGIASTPDDAITARGDLPQSNPRKPTKPLAIGERPAGDASLNFTVYTSQHPPRLAKIIGLNADGSMRKTAVASMARGRAKRCTAADLHELASILERLTSDQAVGWGVCNQDDVPVVPTDQESNTPGAISRSREHFEFANAPGLLMIDHDGLPGGALDAAELRQRLIAACPALAGAPMLWRPSTSAGVQAPDGRQLSGLTRHRIYIPVTDATGIAEAGRRLVTLLWAAGHGWDEVGSAGQALERTLIDAAVWQPERLDFAAPPILEDGLTRTAVAPRIFGDGKAQFDLRLIEVDAATSKRAADNKRAARAKVRDACAKQRQEWAATKAPLLAKARAISEAKARDILIRASERNILMGDFLLTARDGRQVSVGELLDNPDRWHNERFADPLDADEDLRVAVAQLLNGSRPTLFTHRHGGLRFDLMRQSARVQVGRGLRVQATDAVLQVLRDRGDLYDFGEGAVAYVSGGKARAASVDWLTDHMGRVCDFYTVRKRTDAAGNEVIEEVREDAPQPIARAVLAKHGERRFRALVAVVTAPTLRIDGSVLDVPGHDEASGLLYVVEDGAPPRVPSMPTPEDALNALEELWKPLAGFPLVDDVARGVVLHGVFTACLRASLPTAPGIALDAPAAGTGKTLLARCVGILATGSDPSILPPADTDEETRKRLFATLREGARVVVWDNVREPLGCAALDSFLTASTFSDRILGSSETASLPNRAQFIATGNNIRLTGDTCRRVFVARLDAQSERPYARDFSFDPAHQLAAQRLRYVIAVLTIVRAYIAAGRPKCGAGRTASFEAWDDLVRQPLCWLARLVREHQRPGLPTLDDPLKAADLAFESDPETTKHAALLASWHAAFGDTPTTVAQSMTHFANEDLRVALDEIAGQSYPSGQPILNRATRP